MIKKFFSIAIAILLSFTSLNVVVGKEDNLEATYEDFVNLRNMLEVLYNIHNQEFDNTTTKFENVFCPLISSGYSCQGYEYFFGESGLDEFYTFDGKSAKEDPKNILYYEYNNIRDYYYYKLNSDNVDWIARNIYNIEPDHNMLVNNYYDEFANHKNGSTDYVKRYYYDGNYYIMGGDADYIGHVAEISSYKKLSNNKYYVKVKYTMNYESYDGSNVNYNYMVGGLKNINGKRQWTIYKNSKYPFIYNDNVIKILLNGTELSFPQSPYIENGTTRVPMRAIFEALDAEVDYDADTKTITVRKGSTIIKLATGASTATINGREMTLTAPVENKNGSAMVPLRFVSEALGAEVIWDEENKVITITLDENTINSSNSEQEYIDKHKNFINSPEYKYVKDLNLSQDIAIGLSDDKKMQTAVKLNDALSFNWLKKDFNNYYDIILSDMMLNESMYNSVENQFETKYTDNVNTFVSNISNILEEKYTNDFTVDDKNFIEKLFLSNEEIKDTKTYEKVEKILNDTFDENEIIEMLDYGNKISTTVDFMSKGGKVIEAIQNTARYYSVVNAYIDTKQEYKDALKLVSANLAMREVQGEYNEQYDYFKKSLDRYIELNDKNDYQVGLNIAEKAVSEGINASIEMFGEEYINCAVSFVKSIKLSNGLTIAEAASKATAGNSYLAVAADVCAGLGAAKIGYDIGMLFNDTFLPNNDISINIKYLETNGNIAVVTKTVLETCEYNFSKNLTYENAQKFDGVFSFYKGIQTDTCKRMIALDESEKRNLANIFSSKNQKSLDESINNSKNVKEKLEKITCY